MFFFLVDFGRFYISIFKFLIDASLETLTSGGGGAQLLVWRVRCKGVLVEEAFYASDRFLGT